MSTPWKLSTNWQRSKRDRAKHAFPKSAIKRACAKTQSAKRALCANPRNSISINFEKDKSAEEISELNTTAWVACSVVNLLRFLLRYAPVIVTHDRRLVGEMIFAW